MTKIIVGIAITILAIAFAVVWPRRTKLAPELRPLDKLPFSTTLERVNLPDWDGMNLMSRRIDTNEWVASGPFSSFKINRGGPSAIDYLRVDAVFAIDSVPAVIVGRLRDRGAGMHGWYAILVKQGDDEIDYRKTQLYKVWIEKNPPDALEADGTPLVTNPERWYFSGTAAVVGDDYYRGYPEKAP